MKREYLKKEVGSTYLTGEPGSIRCSSVWARPTFEVHGIAGGFTGAGAKTVIPAKAAAKVSMRIVPKQDPEKIVARTEEWVGRIRPKGIQTEVRVLSAGPGLMVNPDHPAIHVAAKAFSDMFGKQTVFTRSGGRFRLWATLLPTWDSDDPDGLRAARRRTSFAQREIQIRNYFDGIRTIAHFYCAGSWAGRRARAPRRALRRRGRLDRSADAAPVERPCRARHRHAQGSRRPARGRAPADLEASTRSSRAPSRCA